MQASGVQRGPGRIERRDHSAKGRFASVERCVHGGGEAFRHVPIVRRRIELRPAHQPHAAMADCFTGPDAERLADFRRGIELCPCIALRTDLFARLGAVRLKHGSGAVGGKKLTAKAVGLGGTGRGRKSEKKGEILVFHARLIGPVLSDCQRRAVAAAPLLA